MVKPAKEARSAVHHSESNKSGERPNPLLHLHRATYLEKPVEEQLEPTELDLLSFDLTLPDLEYAAQELGHTHLGPIDPNVSIDTGCVVGIKKRMLVPRAVTIKDKTLVVMFMLDTSAPVTSVCHHTLRAFDVSPQTRNNLRGSIRLGMTMYINDPEGVHQDMNILGMDYMMRTSLGFDIDGYSETWILRELRE